MFVLLFSSVQPQLKRNRQSLTVVPWSKAWTYGPTITKQKQNNNDAWQLHPCYVTGGLGLVRHCCCWGQAPPLSGKMKVVCLKYSLCYGYSAYPLQLIHIIANPAIIWILLPSVISSWVMLRGCL